MRISEGLGPQRKRRNADGVEQEGIEHQLDRAKPVFEEYRIVGRRDPRSFARRYAKLANSALKISQLPDRGGLR